LSLDRIEAQILRVKLAISTASGFRDGQWADDFDLLQALYTHPTYDEVYDLAQDGLPAYVEDIRGRVYNEPARILARVRTENGVPVVQYVGIVEDTA
jgi:hypothetical protein